VKDLSHAGANHREHTRHRTVKQQLTKPCDNYFPSLGPEGNGCQPACKFSAGGAEYLFRKRGIQMIQLKEAVQAWGRPEFEAVFKKSIADLNSETLPLQKGLTAGSYALDDPIEAVILKTAEHPDSIEIKTQLLYKSLTPGCACPGDPTIENEQLEQCLVLVRIDKQSAAATVTLLDD
jgi:hypothetical protein